MRIRTRRLGHLLEDELGLEDPAEIAVGAIKAVLRTEAGETSQGDRGGGVSGFKRGIETTEPIPLVGDPSCVDLPIRSAHEAPEGAVVTRVDPVEPLLLEAPNPRAEATAEHRERGKIDIGIAVGVRVVLLDLEVALVVKEPVQDGRRVPIRALDGRAEKRGVVVGDEAIELKREIAEPRTVCLLQDFPPQRVPLPVARRGLSLAPVERGVEAGDCLDEGT